MTADQARALARQAVQADAEKVQLVLQCWEAGIRRAAEAGRMYAREDELGRPRTPIPAVARRAALEHLKSLGYRVRTVATGINESTTEVSWE